jgi:hypothetical protein
MTYDDLIRHFGSQPAIQQALNKVAMPSVKVGARQTVDKWKTMPRVPTDYQIAAEIASGGLLEADLPDELFRLRTLNLMRKLQAQPPATDATMTR